MRTKRPFMDGVPHEVVDYVAVLEANKKKLESEARQYKKIVKEAEAGLNNGWINHAPTLRALIDELDD